MSLGPLAIVLVAATLLAFGLLGSTRRIGFWGAVLAFLFLTPPIGFVAILLSGPKRRRRAVIANEKTGTARRRS